MSIRIPRGFQVNQGPGHLGQVATGFHPPCGDSIDGFHGRVVRHEMAGQLGREEAGRGGMAAQVCDRVAPLVFTSLPVSHAQERLVTGLMQHVPEGEGHGAVRRPGVLPSARARQAIREAEAGDGPAREDPGQRLHVGLGIPPVDAERVELEQFAGVVLVESALSSTSGQSTSRGRVRAHADRVVQIDEHRRVTRRGEHHILEAPEHVPSDHLALVETGERGNRGLGRHGHAQVVGPERHQALGERRRGYHAGTKGGGAFLPGYASNPLPGLTCRVLGAAALRLQQSARGFTYSHGGRQCTFG